MPPGASGALGTSHGEAPVSLPSLTASLPPLEKAGVDANAVANFDDDQIETREPGTDTMEKADEDADAVAPFECDAKVESMDRDETKETCASVKPRLSCLGAALAKAGATVGWAEELAEADTDPVTATEGGEASEKERSLAPPGAVAESRGRGEADSEGGGGTMVVLKELRELSDVFSQEHAKLSERVEEVASILRSLDSRVSATFLSGAASSAASAGAAQLLGSRSFGGISFASSVGVGLGGNLHPSEASAASMRPSSPRSPTARGPPVPPSDPPLTLHAAAARGSTSPHTSLNFAISETDPHVLLSMVQSPSMQSAQELSFTERRHTEGSRQPPGGARTAARLKTLTDPGGGECMTSQDSIEGKRMFLRTQLSSVATSLMPEAKATGAEGRRRSKKGTQGPHGTSGNAGTAGHVRTMDDLDVMATERIFCAMGFAHGSSSELPAVPMNTTSTNRTRGSNSRSGTGRCVPGASLLNDAGRRPTLSRGGASIVPVPGFGIPAEDSTESSDTRRCSRSSAANMVDPAQQATRNAMSTPARANNESSQSLQSTPQAHRHAEDTPTSLNESIQSAQQAPGSTLRHRLESAGSSSNSDVSSVQSVDTTGDANPVTNLISPIMSVTQSELSETEQITYSRRNVRAASTSSLGRVGSRRTMENLRTENEAKLVDASQGNLGSDDELQSDFCSYRRQQSSLPWTLRFILNSFAVLPPDSGPFARWGGWMALMYRGFVLALLVAALVYHALRASHEASYFIKLMHVPIVGFILTAFFGNVLLGISRVQDLIGLGGAGPSLLEHYAFRCDFLKVWRSGSSFDTRLMVLLWMSLVVFRTLPAFLFDCPSLEAHLEALPLVSVAISSAMLTALLCCELHICRGLALAVDLYCSLFLQSQDLKFGLRDWNMLQAILRLSARKIEACFIFLNTFMLVMLIFTGVQVFRTDVELGAHMFVCNALSFGWVLPALIQIIYVVFIAASVTEKCSRVPALVNSWNFGEASEESLDTGRQYVVQYIEHSAAGFYVKGVRLTTYMALKFSYFFAVLLFTLLSQSIRSAS